jgi:hypothetical protein
MRKHKHNIRYILLAAALLAILFFMSFENANKHLNSNQNQEAKWGKKFDILH